MKTNVITAIHGDNVKFIATNGKVLKSMDIRDQDNYDTIVRSAKPIKNGESFVFIDDCTRQRYDMGEVINLYELRLAYRTYDESGRPLDETPREAMPDERMIVCSAEIVGQYTYLGLDLEECIGYKWRYILRQYTVVDRYYKTKDRLYMKLKRRFGINLPFPERMKMRNIDIVKLVAKTLNYRILNIVYV